MVRQQTSRYCLRHGSAPDGSHGVPGTFCRYWGGKQCEHDPRHQSYFAVPGSTTRTVSLGSGIFVDPPQLRPQSSKVDRGPIRLDDAICERPPGRRAHPSPVDVTSLVRGGPRVDSCFDRPYSIRPATRGRCGDQSTRGLHAIRSSRLRSGHGGFRAACVPPMSTERDIRTYGSSTERQSYDSVKVLPTQTRCDEEAFALPKTVLANDCRSADRTAVIPLGRIRPVPTPPSASMRLHESNCLPGTSSKFSRIGPDAFGRYALPSILPRAPAARVPRGIAVTQTSSPARAAALHASRSRPA